jgi:hypothetical protein
MNNIYYWCARTTTTALRLRMTYVTYQKLNDINNPGI